MRKKIFFYLLRKFSKNEKGRIEILSEIHNSICDEYSEQTVYGNIYNANYEFIASSARVRKAISNGVNEIGNINLIKYNLINSFEDAIKDIKNEKI